MGFIKPNQELLNWEWFDDKNTVYVYLWLTMRAAWCTTRYHGIEIERGQIITTYPEIAEKCDVTIRQARTIIDRLKSTGKAAVKITPKFSIITLLEYDCNDKSGSLNDSQMTDKRQSARQSNDSLSLLDTDYQNCRQSEYAPAREAPEKTESDSQIPDVKKSNKLEKREFAEFVSMTNDEYSSLVTKLGEQGAKRCIEILDNYKGQNGKTYKSDYRAILNWVITRYEEEQAKRKQPAQSRPQQASGTGNPFLDMLRELEEKEANEIDV